MSDYDKEGNHGRWTLDEHHRFIEAINQFGREWDKVQAVVKTRSLAQVRSHAQKYFLKISRSEEDRANDYEFWRSTYRQYCEHFNAMMVLDYMNNVLKRMKIRRDELLQRDESSTIEASDSSVVTLDSNASTDSVAPPTPE
jgi:SHAQKYF class myb-like DNA-binding protein